MRKNKRLLVFFAIITITLNFLLFYSSNNKIIYTTAVTLANADDSLARNPDSYWSVNNKPVFYGATKITIKKGLVDEFDINDARFRIFAKDFEDGDLTPNIKYHGTVDVNIAGTYNITYEVKDSHGNETSIIVPVIITDDENAKINVERTLYTTPSVWNMDIAGFSRCNYGDRQILGLFMPANSSIRVRTISSENNITIDFLANDSYKESSQTIKNDGNWVVVSNTKSEDSVPLFRTIVLSKEKTVINKVFKIEIEYDESVKELDYYHYMDDEEAYFQRWRASQNTYSVIENEVLTVICPFADIDIMINHNKYNNGFKTFTSFLEYYQKVVDKMDSYIGLDLNPEKLTDQNVRTKYLVKPNIHGGGAAYYSGNHVGVHSPSISAFFQMNWGGLHEIAHGYQGNLGKGNMGLGEVANNILGHYIQIDKNIYFHPGDWLGNLKNIETGKNASRLNAQKYNDVDVSTKLYMIVNLFDTFEGGETYAKMFSWYRENLNNGMIKDANANQDIYARFFGEVYHVNIIPYMEAWKLEISDNVKEEIFNKNYPSMTILNDLTSVESLEKIMTGEDIDLKYGLVNNEVYKKYGLKGSLTIDIDIDNIEKLKGKYVIIKDKEDIIKKIEIDSDIINVKDLAVGSYNIQMPVLDNYNQQSMNVVIKEGVVNNYTYKYKAFSDTDIGNYYSLQLNGYYNTYGYKLTFSDKYTKAKIEFGQAGYININSAGVKIYDENGLIVSDEVKGYDADGNLVPDGLYFNFKKGSYVVDLKPGYIIEVTHSKKDKVIWTNSLTGKNIPSYTPVNTTTRYKIIENGIVMEGMDESVALDIAYQSLRDKIISFLNNYKEKVTDEELNNRIINFREKNQVINYYEQLKDNDKEPYKELIMRIKRGGVPKIDYIGESEYKLGSIVDLYQLITAQDNEDYDISINSSNTKIDTQIDFNQAGEYKVTYFVNDSDKNVANYEVNIKVVGEANQEPDVPLNPSLPDEPSSPDKDEPSNPDTGKPNNPMKPQENVNNQGGNNHNTTIDSSNNNVAKPNINSGNSNDNQNVVDNNKNQEENNKNQNNDDEEDRKENITTQKHEDIEENEEKVKDTNKKNYLPIIIIIVVALITIIAILVKKFKR